MQRTPADMFWRWACIGMICCGAAWAVIDIRALDMLIALLIGIGVAAWGRRNV